MLEVVKSLLRTEGLNFEVAAKLPMLRLIFEGQHRRFVTHIHYRAPIERLLVYAGPEQSVSEDRRGQLVLLLSQINYGLTLGNLEMDLDDGHLRARGSLDLSGIEPTEALVRPLLFSVPVTLDSAWPAIQCILNGGSVDEGRAVFRKSVGAERC